MEVSFRRVRPIIKGLRRTSLQNQPVPYLLFTHTCANKRPAKTISVLLRESLSETQRGSPHLVVLFNVLEQESFAAYSILPLSSFLAEGAH